MSDLRACDIPRAAVDLAFEDAAAFVKALLAKYAALAETPKAEP